MNMAAFASGSADKTVPGHYAPSQTALLLLDFHSMFVKKAGGASASAASTVASGMRTWAKSVGITVIHCLIDTSATPFSTCKDLERFASIVAAMKSSGGDAEPAELTSGGGDITFTRRPGHASAFKSPGLEDFLKQREVKSLILTGLSTSGCVMRTAITACDEEYVVSVISDGCADPAEGVHDLMIGKILNNRGYVFTAAEFQEGYQGVARSLDD
ncbi:Isochorismatase hydrolase [Polychaeton citri CBS 116435]|uniref:Isochorismatase hydrolase n=1 Tax=Polychaeton citri CBS 116435 TaxID=1314669 RepID=A0A9P4UM84_9PEZI|nr:Isochorismatase hydrolase [Polychaeton citri CBS 116435]